MAKPVDTDNYGGEPPVQLFAHNAMTLEAAREDLGKFNSIRLQHLTI